MRGFAIALVLIVVAGFSFIGLIIGGAFPQHESKIAIYLNTKNMQEADNRIIDSTMGPAVIEAYPAIKSNAINNGVPWTDMFVCVKVNSTDTSKTDTILLLDTRTGINDDLSDVTKYWTGIKPAPRLNQCRILIPEKLAKRVQTYPYKYCDVRLITDD